MLCLGRTRTLRRCRREVPQLFCHSHRFQPLFAVFSLIATAGVLAGLYRDVLEPWWTVPQPTTQQTTTRAEPALPSVAKSYAFVALECPGTGNTHPTSLNKKQEVVGTCDVDGNPRAFLWDHRTGFTYFENAEGHRTVPTGINARGEVVGFFYVSTSEGQRSHGFLRRSDGRILSFDPPGSRETYAHSVNDSGTIVGAYVDSLRTTRGFIRDSNGSFENIDAPEAAATTPTAVNNKGEIAGYFMKTGVGDRGFIRQADRTFLALEPDVIQPKSMNDSGALVGLTRVGGFVHLAGQSIQGLEHPACQGSCSILTGINESSDIVGQYQLGSRVYGFIASPHSKTGN